MHDSERNRLAKLQTALLLAAADFDQAAAAAHALDAEAEDAALMRALETAIAVCYSRAFTQSTLLRLGGEYGPPAGSADAELHRFLLRTRDKVYAHTDKTSGRRTSTNVSLATGDATVITVEWQEEWLPFPREYIPGVIDLCGRQALRFRTEAAAIQLHLDAPAPGGSADEVLQRAAEQEHKASALHRLGWETGAGATIWARSIQDELARHEKAREDHAANTADLQAWERFHGSALLLVVAIDQVLAFDCRVRSLTGDAELAKARARFDAVGPDAEELRDLVAHLDAYAVGQGRRQTGKATPPLTEEHLETFLYWGNGGGTELRLGDKQVNLRAAAHAAVELAHVVERVRAKHLQITEQEANAAMRRRYGLPPE